MHHTLERVVLWTLAPLARLVAREILKTQAPASAARITHWPDR